MVRSLANPEWSRPLGKLNQILGNKNAGNKILFPVFLFPEIGNRNRKSGFLFQTYGDEKEQVPEWLTLLAAVRDVPKGIADDDKRGFQIRQPTPWANLGTVRRR